MAVSDTNQDTIVAIATPPGRGGVGVVRVSGPLCTKVAHSMLGQVPTPRQVRYVRFKDSQGEMLDQGLALYFQGPASFTGEDVLELHGHGGPVVMDMLLNEVVALGARPAEPGEFSQRAFLNDKLDLSQAEAIADLIDSGSQRAVKAAGRSLMGEFSKRVERLVVLLTELRVHVEAAIDFPEEEIDFLSDAQLATRLTNTFQAFDELKAAAQQGVLLKEGMTLVIAGPPNAGKSSLLNRLAGHDAAIVTDIPGTTRDVLKQHIHLDGMPLHVVDTAGLRESTDVVEQEGIRRAQAAMEEADRVLWVVDCREPVEPASLENTTVVLNKSDLVDPDGVQKPEHPDTLLISAKTGAGITDLKAHLKAIMGYESESSGLISARRRHLVAMDAAYQHLERGKQQLNLGAGELMAEELRLAQDELGKITGAITSDELLGKIFSSFCIGK